MCAEVEEETGRICVNKNALESKGVYKVRTVELTISGSSFERSIVSTISSVRSMIVALLTDGLNICRRSRLSLNFFFISRARGRKI